jgi:ATP-dependent DNA helicase RecG
MSQLEWDRRQLLIPMVSDEKLKAMLRTLEADNVERTVSVAKPDKIGEAICSFANDLPDRRDVGVLFLGANDDGSCGGIKVSDQMLLTLLDFGRDGRIVPLPSITARKVSLDGCEMAVVEVLPSDNPPVRYNGRVCVRRGPQRGLATPEEERRLTEKRRWGNLAFDQHGVVGAKFDDIDLKRFRSEYLPAAVSPEVLAENKRDEKDQLLGLRFLSKEGQPTVAALLVLGVDPRNWIRGAYIQFVRYDGPDQNSAIKDQKEVGGALADQLLRINEIFEANIAVATDVHGELEVRSPDYPIIALQELIRNAVIHRNYESSNAPTRITWYSDRVEIASPGGPFGQVTIQNFGTEHVTDYRNPTVAEAAKSLGFIQRFGSGIPRARAALLANSNPPLEFQVNESFVLAVVRRRT